MPSDMDRDRRLLQFARKMRHEPSDAERRLWRILRGRRLAGFKFRRQFPIGGYIVDFYCIPAKLVVECDGGQHNDEEAKRYDEKRSERLAKLGIGVIRFWADDVLKLSFEVSEAIYNALNSHMPSPRPGRGQSPNPLPSPGVPGEGEMPPSPQPSPGVPGEGENAHPPIRPPR